MLEEIHVRQREVVRRLQLEHGDALERPRVVPNEPFARSLLGDAVLCNHLLGTELRALEATQQSSYLWWPRPSLLIRRLEPGHTRRSPELSAPVWPLWQSIAVPSFSSPRIWSTRSPRPCMCVKVPGETQARCVSDHTYRHRKSRTASRKLSTIQAVMTAMSGPSDSQPAPRRMLARKASTTAVSGRA